MVHITRDETKDQHPYLNAPRGTDNGTKSCNWRRDDRILSVCCQVGAVLICILLVAGMVYIVV
jgi:hypothetical protein